MKRVKVMLSAILIWAIAAGALAFKVKTVNVCAYSRTIMENPPATTICPLVGICVLTITMESGATNYARTLLPAPGQDCCPITETVCPLFRTLTVED